MMHRNASRLHVLINQLLDLSRIEAGKMKLQLEEINLRRMIMTLCSAFQSQADERNMDYQVNLQDEIGIGCVDRDKLEKIIYNLISNAFKFTARWGMYCCRSAPGIFDSPSCEATMVLVSQHATFSLFLTVFIR